MDTIQQQCAVSYMSDLFDCSIVLIQNFFRPNRICPLTIEMITGMAKSPYAIQVTDKEFQFEPGRVRQTYLEKHSQCLQ